VVATINFRMVDRVLGPSIRPEAAARLEPLAPADRRAVLRHLASELNRWMFRWWSVAQAILGLALLTLLWRQGAALRTLVGAAVLLVALQLGALAPAIARLGRTLDFVPRPLPAASARAFGLLHAAYVGADFLKAILLAGSAWIAVRR
jgi:hypothetical protein